MNGSTLWDNPLIFRNKKSAGYQCSFFVPLQTDRAPVLLDGSAPM